MTRHGPGYRFGLERLAPGLAVLATLVVLLASPAWAAKPYAAIVIDATNGNILYQRNPDQPMYPASLTKMMTLYMMFEALEAGGITLETEFPVSKRAADQLPSKLGLRRGQSITAGDAIMALMTKSANDVAVAVAEGLGEGSEWTFSVGMTGKARELGMRNTTFTNASGWHRKDMLSTARDMMILSLRLQSDFPQHYHLFATDRFTYKGQTYRSHNKLLGSVEGVDGLKTGYTTPAGWNLAASALVDGRRIVAVIMGGKSRQWRDRRMRQLISTGFELAEQNHRDAPLPGEHPGRGGTVTQFAGLEPDGGSALVDMVAEVLEPDGQVPGIDQGSSADDQSWAVQVGAYSQANNAARVREHAEAFLGHLFGDPAMPVVTTVESGGTTLYRVRIVNLSEHQAREGCRVLDRENLPCAVLDFTEN